MEMQVFIPATLLKTDSNADIFQVFFKNTHLEKHLNDCLNVFLHE